MYAIASWSPSQSEPLTVSKHVPAPFVVFDISQGGADATLRRDSVASRGKDLVMQAVFKPAATIPSVARSPAPPAPRTITSKEWSTIS